MILAGDIGGTKTTVAIFDGDRVVREETVHSLDHASLEEIVKGFLQGEPLAAASFGVAGPVVGGVAKITQLPWTIATDSLRALLGGVPVTLLNDLQATAFGMLVIPDDKFAVLQGRATKPTGATTAIMAPGTGLGEATLYSTDGTVAGYRALPSEGGHADFAPGTDEEIEFLHFQRRQHGEHVSVERVLSGAGLGDLYAFALAGAAAPASIADAPDRNAAVSKAALDGSDPVAVHAMELFVALLGAEASNLALRALAAGGVILGGGIPPKILPALQQPRFLARFTQKGRFTDWARGLDVRVALEPRAALYGAAHHAFTSSTSTGAS